MESTFCAPDIECDGCANSIRRVLGRIDGVMSIDVDVLAKNVHVVFDPPASPAIIAVALDHAGFPVAPAE